MYQTSSQANQACNADLASYVERYSPWNTCQLSGANCNLVSGENYWLFQVQTSCSAPEYIEKKKYGYSGEKDQYSRYFTRSKAVEACRKFWSDQGKGDKEGEAFNCVDSPSGHIVHDYFGEWDHLTCGHDYHYEPNEAPNLTISSPSSTGSYYYGVPISLRGNVSDDIDSNLSSKIDWFLDSNISLGRGANFYASIPYGSHIISARVKDSQGATDSASVTIKVKHSISVSIQAVGETEKESWETFTLQGGGSIDGQSTSSLNWYLDGALYQSNSSQVSFSELSPGNHTVYARVSRDGDTKQSASITLTVLENTVHVELVKPTQRRIFDLDEPIEFQANATYKGSPYDANLQWSVASIGSLGQGGTITYSDMPEGDHTVSISAGSLPVDGGTSVLVTVYDREKNLGDENDGQACAGNPINIFSGNKIQRELDFKTGGESPLYLQRVYNSYSKDTGLFGYGWISVFDQKLKYDSGAQQAAVIDETGAAQRFDLVNGQWVDESSSKGELVRNADNSWTYTMYDNTVKTYNASGQIRTIKNFLNHDLTFNYVNGRLSTVTDEFGRTISFTFNGSGLVSDVLDPDQQKYSYRYNGTNLQYVYFPDATPNNLDDNAYKEYHYENAQYPNALTGITDEERKRFATWKYDSFGRAWSSEHAGKEVETVSYNSDGTVTTTNQKGRSTIFSFASIKGLLKVTDVVGEQTSNCAAAFQNRTYDPDTGFVDTTTDWRGNVTEYETNEYGQVESKIVHDTGLGWARTLGGEVTYESSVEYDSKQLPWNITTPGLYETRTYTSENRPWVITKTDTTNHSVPYSTNGQVRQWQYTYVMHTGTDIVKTITLDGPRSDNDQIVQEFDLQGNLISVKNSKNHEVRFTDYNAKGQPGNKYDENNLRTEYLYNERGWLRFERVYVSTGVLQTEYIYYKNGLLKEVRQSNGADISYEYNDARHLTAIENNLGERKEYTPDDMTGEWMNYVIKNASGAVEFSMDRVFDDMGRLKEAFGANGQYAVNLFDPNSNLVNSAQVADYDNQTMGSESYYVEATRYYDALNRIRIENRTGEPSVFYGYDAAGNLSQVLVSDNAAYSPQPGYGYDSLGQLQTQSVSNPPGSYVLNTDGELVGTAGGTPSGQLTEYVYNGFGERIMEVSPATGTTVYYYDGAGNLDRKIREDDTQVENDTDQLNRILSVSYSANSAENITYTYDTAPNGVGRLATITDQSGTRSYAYTDLGAIDYITYSIDGTVYTIDYNYDSSARLFSITYPSERTLTYGYDDLSRINSVTAQGQPQGSSVLISDVTYRPFGPTDRIVYGNGFVRDIEFDESYRADQIQNDWVLLQNTIDLDYDTLGRIRGEALLKTVNGSTSMQSAKYYGYNANSRLESVRWFAYNQQSISPLGNAITYDYDGYGNRTLLQRYDSTAGVANDLVQTVVYTPDATSNRLTNITTSNYSKSATTTDSVAPTYSTLGHTKTDASFEYIYNQAERIVTVKSNNQQVQQNLYNALGERVRKTGSGKTIHYHYDLSGALIAETDTSGTLIREYAYLNGVPIAMFGGADLYSTSESSSDYLVNTELARLVSSVGESAEIFSGLQGDGEIYSNLVNRGGSQGDTFMGISLREDPNDASSAGVSVQLSSYSQFVPIINGAIIIPLFILVDTSIDVIITDVSGSTTTESITFAGQTWIKLSREGQYVNVETSADGISWNVLRQYTLSLNEEAFIGVISSNTNTDIQFRNTINNDNVFYIHPDHLGSPYAVSNNAKNIVWKRDTFELGASPFGADLTVNGKQFSTEYFEMPLRFPGQYWDRETGNHYNYFRDYDPSLGRYVQSDPIGLAGGVNTFSYVSNDPLLGVDIYGLSQMNRSRYAPGIRWQDMTCEERYASVRKQYMATGIAALGGLLVLEGAVVSIMGPQLGLLYAIMTDSLPAARFSSGVAKGISNGAENVNAGAALDRKLSALEGAQQNAAKVRELPDGRIRYYEAERAARNPGPTRGSSYVTEYNPANGNVRSWNEAYDQAGNVNRVHPKMINGQTVDSQHYPPTARELGL